ncbi:MAG: hypothetical protein ACKVY0_02570 [Prosthecobacter sp.]|uniref:hypothetical protein n=1 Tax=Prosthecobacter sp. TaxID=1965333 RepID=UPI00390340BD
MDDWFQRGIHPLHQRLFSCWLPKPSDQNQSVPDHFETVREQMANDRDQLGNVPDQFWFDRDQKRHAPDISEMTGIKGRLSWIICQMIGIKGKRPPDKREMIAGKSGLQRVSGPCALGDGDGRRNGVQWPDSRSASGDGTSLRFMLRRGAWGPGSQESARWRSALLGCLTNVPLGLCLSAADQA